MSVKDRKALHWPQNIADGPRLNKDGLPRPYVVDWSDPVEREVCKGQEYKLEPAPDDAEPTPITSRPALKAMARMRNEPEPEPEKTVADKVAENHEAAKAPEAAELPGITKRPAAKKRASKKAPAPKAPEGEAT